jgi:acetyl esterase/lipase
MQRAEVVYRTINGHTLLLDILRPDPLPAEPLPVVIYLYGSGWRENKRLDATQNPGPFLVQHSNLCVISIEYRSTTQDIFPAQIADARAAVRWVRAHANEYHLDPERIGAWGYSSGGHLAALLGIAAHVTSFDDGGEYQEYSCRVQAVVTLGAPMDFLRMGGHHDDPDSSEAYLVGGPIHEHLEMVRLTNPITHVKDQIPPFLILHGELDDVVRVDQASLLYDALKPAGVDVTLLTFPGASHEVGPDTSYWQGMCEAALTFFEQKLA